MVRRKAQMSPWDEMEKLWDNFNSAVPSPRKPVVRINNDESMVTVEMELPGFSSEDIDVQVKENLLLVQALREEELTEEASKEKKQAEKQVVFEKSFVIPEDLSRDQFEAEMKNGLLTLTLPRKEKPQALSIKVKG